MAETTNGVGAIATLRRRDGRLLQVAVSALLVVATAACEANFRYPTTGLQFYHLDTIEVSYQSRFSYPTLSLLCGERARPSEKLRLQQTAPTGSELVPLNFSSADPCWFRLEPHTGECGVDSASFTLETSERPGNLRRTIGLLSTTAAIAPRATATTSGLLSSAPTTTTTTTPPSTSATKAGTVASTDAQGGHDLSGGAKAGIGIGVASLVGVAAMAAFMHFRRRKKGQDSEIGRAIRGRKPEKLLGRNGASSVNSGRSDEPLNPIVDGFPGSMGYDDARSLNSMHSLHSIDTHNTHVSPSTGYSPNVPSQQGGFWTERDELAAARGFWTDRDELTAARLKSQPIPIVTSYGPNPVTPTLTPRPSSRFDLSARAASISIDSREGIPPMPAVPPFVPDFSDYTIPTPPKPRTSASPPRKPAAPIIVSYGPNRVTPTPAVTTPTVPPDETIFQRSKDPKPVAPQDRQFSWEDSPIEPMAPSAMGPLPPYASSAEYEAMEKGAIRKLATPEAQELPPTKDGYYPVHNSDIVEYSELPGAARHNEPQLPYHPHPYKRHPEGGPSSGAASGSGNASGGGGLREIDEQKFLLLPEISNLRAQKKKKTKPQPQIDEDEDEEYDLGEPRRR